MTLYKKLRWLLQMGVDETVSDTPVNRLRPKTPSVIQTPQISDAPVVAQMPCDNVVQLAITAASQAHDVDTLHTTLMNFNASSLKKTAANTVFARGNPSANIMIIGDIPEASDDLAGQPFTGETGDLLTKMMTAIQLDINTHCYLTTLIPWRAPGGRKPTSAEIAHCAPFVKRHIELIQPKILVLLGATTAGALLGIDSLSRARGIWHSYGSENLSAPIPTIVTLTPAFLLKNSAHKKHAWEDLKRLRAKLDESTDKK